MDLFPGKEWLPCYSASVCLILSFLCHLTPPSPSHELHHIYSWNSEGNVYGRRGTFSHVSCQVPMYISALSIDVRCQQTDLMEHRGRRRGMRGTSQYIFPLLLFYKRVQKLTDIEKPSNPKDVNIPPKPNYQMCSDYKSLQDSGHLVEPPSSNCLSRRMRLCPPQSENC